MDTGIDQAVVLVVTGTAGVRSMLDTIITATLSFLVFSVWLIAPAPKATDTEEQQAQQEAQLKRAEAWMERSLLESVKPAMTHDWILKQSANVKRLVLRHWPRDAWCNVGQGWEAHEDQLRRA